MSEVEGQQAAVSEDTNPVEAPAKEEVIPSPESSEVEEQKEVETVEQKAARLEKELEAAKTKNARQTAAYAQQQKALERARQEYQEAVSKQTEKKEEEPKVEDFDSLSEWKEELAKYHSKIAKREYELDLSKKQMEAAQAKIMQERESIRAKQEAEYISLNPNYEASKNEVTTFIDMLAQTGGMSPQVEHAITSQAFDGNVPALLDYFGANSGERLGELQEIFQMPPHKAAVEIYKIQQKLGTPKKKEEKPLPTPSKPLAGAAKTTKQLSADLSYEELKKRIYK